MQDIASRVGGAPRDNGVRGVSLSAFQDTRPLPFATAVHPMEAEDWLKDTERKLRAVGCTEEEKVRYAVHLLAGPAASWWENTVAIYPPEKVFTWEEFKKKFHEHHVPESIMELKRREFEDLKQNNNPIMKYINDFTDLSRYAVDDVNTEEKRKKRFLRGLHPYVKMQLRPAAIQTFQQLVNAAITFEDDYKQVQEERKKHAKLEPERFQPNKPTPTVSFKPRFQSDRNTSNQGLQNPGKRIICGNCGVPGHTKSECRKPKIICYGDRKSTRLNSSHSGESRMPSSA